MGMRTVVVKMGNWTPAPMRPGMRSFLKNVDVARALVDFELHPEEIKCGVLLLALLQYPLHSYMLYALRVTGYGPCCGLCCGAQIGTCAQCI